MGHQSARFGKVVALYQGSKHAATIPGDPMVLKLAGL
jgi:hypothetical protein